MVPRIGRQGSSFKGAGLYYLHDKDASTSDRVAFTHTENLPTDDPNRALDWMAYTAIDAENIKRESGVKRTGGRSEKPVWTLSLSWHPEQDPTHEHMIDTANSALAALGLKNHQAVMVAHNDEPHPHIHAILNLIDPETGRTASLPFTKEKLSKWAQGYEQEHGKIYCPQREENNAKREKAKQQDNEEFPRYKDPEATQKALISRLYHEAKTGKAFQKALAANGFMLAQGKRIVVLDSEGKHYSIFRQIEGTKAKDIRSKLSDLELPNVSEIRGVHERRQGEDEKDRLEGPEQETTVPSPAPPSIINALLDRHYDELANFHTGNSAARARLEATLDKQYGQNARILRREIRELEHTIENSGQVRKFFMKLTGRLGRIEKNLHAKQETLQNIDWRHSEALGAFEKDTVQQEQIIRARQAEDLQYLQTEYTSPTYQTSTSAEFGRVASNEQPSSSERSLGTSIADRGFSRD